MEEKYTSITIVGAYKAVFVFLFILLLAFFNLSAPEFIVVKDILFLIVVLCIVPLFEGYLEYKRYKLQECE
jgi:uncharacterized RDD family membrane protein YckC